ncbi:MAG: DNA polymerase/3'-5' exonuclease PolX [Chloroflexi bacterium]|nr:DNA polymerase/3'-5' exonuclease PolX [Chloroflexota bacterium]MCL5076068.1 DNA polymerase/3'-5' exonuclease PolX [Chloroflexota bacterium]
MRNKEVSRILEDIADILEIKGESPFRIGAYREAARRIENLIEDVAKLTTEGKLRKIPGVGESIAAKIEEYLSTGRCQYYEDIKKDIPEGLVHLLQVPGLGPRKAQLLYKELGITGLEDLEKAAQEHRLRHLPGMGEKSEENLLRELERWKQRTQRYLLGVALPAAEEVASLMRGCLAVRQIDPAGSIRRMRQTIGDIDLLAASEGPERVMEFLVSLPMVKEVIARGSTKSSILTYDNLQIDLRVVEPDSYGAALQYFTGSKSHNIALRELAQRKGLKISEYGIFEEASGKRLGGEKEEDIYRLLGMSYIPPELRENRGEIESALRGTLPQLIDYGELRGDLHVHSNWSDGTDSLEDIALAARARGYEYLAICDHSQSLGIARGLSLERVREQRKTIIELNKKLYPFRLLAGIEVDIRGDGTLDYDDEVLQAFDLVSASIHSGFGQSKERITQRLIGAIQNPYVDVICHPTGRLIGKREAYELDLEAVLEAAAQTYTALEINAAPDRLDLDDIGARRAVELGIPLVINTDAHSTSQLGFARYGIATARRGWVDSRSVLNTLPLEQLLARLSRHRFAAVKGFPTS